LSVSLRGSSFLNAPFPFSAKYILFSAGRYAPAINGAFPWNKVTRTPNQGIPEAKLEVPSRGSIIQVYSDPLSLKPVSSDRRLCPGNLSVKRFFIAWSLAMSASVTILLCDSFCIAFNGLLKNSRSILPPVLRDRIRVSFILKFITR
jgi:hypothetical protein